MKTLFHLFCLSILLIQPRLYGATVWYPTFPNPPQSGFWDDPTKWHGSVVPQDGESVEIFGLGDSTYTKQVTVTYRNTYDPGAVFNGLLLGSGFADIRFILQDPFTSSGNIGVQDRTVFEHSAGKLIAPSIQIIGDSWRPTVSTYDLSGTASITDDAYTGGTNWGGLSLSIRHNAKFQMGGGSLAATRLQLTGTLGIPPLYKQTGGVANLHQVYLEGTNSSAFRISGGVANVYHSMWLGSNDQFGSKPQIAAGALAELEVSGLGTLDLYHPEQPLLAGLIIGDDFPASVHQFGSSQVKVGHILYVGFHTNGTYTLDGGALDASTVYVGKNSASGGVGEFIQNGGTVTLASNRSFTGSLGVGLGVPSGIYRLNNGLLSTETTTASGLFAQLNGTHQCSTNLAIMGGNYIFSGGTIDTAQLVINSGVLHYNAGTLNDRGFMLWGGTLNQAAGLHHQTDGDAQIQYPGGTIAMGPGATHTITGQLALFDTSFSHASGAISCGSLVTDMGPVVLDQNGGNLTILGTAELLGSTIWKLRSGIVFHGGDLMLGLAGSPTDGSYFQQSGGIYTARGFTLYRDTGMTLSGGNTQFSEDGTVYGALMVQPGADFSARDLLLNGAYLTGASLTQSGGVVNVSALICQKGASFQQVDGDWVTTGDMTLNQATNSAIGFHGGTTEVGGTLDYSGFGNLGGGNAVLLVDNGAALSIGADLRINTTGSFVQKKPSSIHITGAHVLAEAADADVFQSVAYPSPLSSGSASVGGLGRGQLEISGQHTVTGLLTVGSSTVSPSVYKVLLGGTLHAGAVHLAFNAGDNGQMELDGSTTIDTTLKIADAVGAMGELRFKGSALNAEDISVGGAGTGSFLHDKGTLTCLNALTLHSGSSYQFTAGRIDASQLEIDGASFQQSGGDLVTTGDVIINQGTNAVGFHGGKAEIGGTIDYRGLGNLGGGNALLLVDGTADWEGEGDFLIGSSGAVIQSGTASIQVDGAHVLAAAASEDVFHSIGSGSSLASGSAVVGGLGRGQLMISGTHSVTGLLAVGAASSALVSIYSLSGSGTLQANEMRVASATGSRGTFYSYGTATVPGNVAIANATNAIGTLNLYAGSITAGSFSLGGLTGQGTMFQDNGTLTCAGTAVVHGGSSYALISGTLAASQLDNRGSFTVQSGGLYNPRLRAPVNNTGTFTLKKVVITDIGNLSHLNSGIIDLQSSADWQFSSGNSLTNLSSGTISGVGKLGGTGFTLINQGTLTPGGWFGFDKVTVVGHFTQTAGGVLKIKIGGTSVSEFDRLVFSGVGSRTLGGKLSISFGNTITPTSGQSFQLISGLNLVEQFSTVQITSPMPPGLGYTLTSTSSSVTLNIVDLPDVPGAITATGTSTSAIQVDWTDTNSGAASHRVRIAPSSSGPWTEAGTALLGTDTLLVEGLSTGTPYWFTVQAYDRFNVSGWSSPTAATTWSALEAWRFEHFGSIANSGNGADAFAPMGDGIPNLEKYALGLDPQTDSTAHANLPRPVFLDVGTHSVRHFGVEFRTADPPPDDVSIDVLVSDDLTSWQATPIPYSTNQPLPEILRHVWRTLEPMSEDDRRFLRLRFLSPPP